MFSIAVFALCFGVLFLHLENTTHHRKHDFFEQIFFCEI